MSNKNWRITTDVYAYLPHLSASEKEHKIYLAAPEKKQYQTNVIKLIQEAYSEVRLELNEFKLKVELGNVEKGTAIVFISSDQLPGGNSVWYKVENYHMLQLNSIFLEVENKKGQFESDFEAGFCEECPGDVIFVTSGMTAYSQCIEEFRRRMNCELFKKTKKWIPGHRYDSPKESIFYLGPVHSRKKNPLCSEFQSSPVDMPEAYLYVNTLKDTDKKVSDILNTRAFGSGVDDIKISTTMSCLVDSGEVLENDMSDDIMNYWDNMINNTINKSSVVSDHGYVVYDHPENIFNILSYQSISHFRYSLSKSTKDKLEQVLEYIAKDCIINNWEKPKFRKDMNLNKSNSVEGNIESCKKLLYTSFQDPNVSKVAYFDKLFQEAGINLGRVIESSITSWDENSILSSFDTYLKYLVYFESRKDSSKCISTQRVNSTNYELKKITVKDLFSDSTLTDTILEMIEYAKDNYGFGITEYSITNVGSKRDPKEFITCVISLDDIIKYKNGVSKMAENLKNDIIRYRFCSVTVMFDIDGKVE